MKQLMVDTLNNSSLDEYNTMLYIESADQFSHEDLQQIGVALNEHYGENNKYRTALVVSTKLQFALARVFDSYRISSTLRIFYELTEALAWLEITDRSILPDFILEGLE